MNNNPVLIDTDGQLDSFWGLILAKKMLNVKAITVCAGKNSNLDTSVKNTMGFAAMAGLRCPVYAGSERSVLKREKPAGARFLPDGKCGLPLPPVPVQPQKEPAWDHIYQEAKEAEGELIVLCMGPMTNLALAIFKYPDLPKMIKKVVFVGGSYDFGDYTSTVEINMATDPEAASAVFQSGIRLEMYGYNAELKSALSNGEVGQIVDGANGAYTTAFAMSAMSHAPGKPIYYGPAIAVMGLAEPERVTQKRYNVFVEIKSDICRGRTTVLNMYTPLGHAKDTLVTMDVDKEYYIGLLKNTLAEYEAL